MVFFLKKLKRMKITIKSFIAISILTNLFCLTSCSKKTNGQQQGGGGSAGPVEILVGTKRISTDKYTKAKVPVVPMWKAQKPTTDLRNGAGLQLLTEAEHANVWQPQIPADGGYNHYACLINYKGQFFAMWGNHSLGEDAPGQRVLFSRSNNWNSWGTPQEIFPAPGPVKPRTEDGIHLKPDRWAIVDDILYAITYVHGAGRYPIARSVDENGNLGTPFLLGNLPSNAGLPEYMIGLPNQNTPVAVKILAWYKQTNQISWWAAEDEGIQRTGIDGATLIESFTYKAKDNGSVLFMRNWGTSSNPVHNNRLYVCFNNGPGSWGRPHPTDIPDAPSRAQAITLSDGKVLLIGNQNVTEFDIPVYLDRDPITVSISSDGYSFEKVYALRTGSPTSYRIPGIGGRNPGFAYSSSIVFNDYLYTLYSVGKEDMAITRVPLSTIKLP